MMLEEEVMFVLNKFVSMKMGACSEAGGPADLYPVLHMRGMCGKQKYCVAGGHTALKMTPAWTSLALSMRPEIVVFAAEAYCGPERDYERGRFGRDFNENLSDDVFEIITVQGVEIKTGRQFGGFVKFVIGDDGLPVFGRPQFAFSEGDALLCAIPNSLEQLRLITVRGIFNPEIN